MKSVLQFIFLISIFSLGIFPAISTDVSAKGETNKFTTYQKDSLKKNSAETRQKQAVPRIALTGINDVTNLKIKTTNLLIYNTATAGTGVQRVTPGYYHNTGSTEKPVWERIDVKVKEAVEHK